MSVRIPGNREYVNSIARPVSGTGTDRRDPRTAGQEGGGVTFKKSYDFHPLACWYTDTGESPAMPPRRGNAGGDTVTDHLRTWPGSPAVNLNEPLMNRG
jgi:hypothetical protein